MENEAAPENIIRPDGGISRRTFHTSDAVVLSFFETGQPLAGEGLSLAFIPGWSMPAAIWHKQLVYFASRYHTVALDPRGQGESEAPLTGYCIDRRASDIKEFLERLPRVLLIGWSLGALEALQYVHMFGGDCLAGLVLVDSSVGQEPQPEPGNFMQRLRQDRDSALWQFVETMFAAPPAEQMLAGLVASAKRMSLDASLALFQHPYQRGHWRTVSEKLEKPLLYVVTAQFAAQAQNLKRNRPATQIAIFERAGHALFFDEPARFNQLIEDFARTLSA